LDVSLEQAESLEAGKITQESKDEAKDRIMENPSSS
jgi:hypothetical protein